MPPVHRALLELSTGGVGRDRSFAMQRSRQGHMFRQTTDMNWASFLRGGALFMSNRPTVAVMGLSVANAQDPLAFPTRRAATTWSPHIASERAWLARNRVPM